MMMRGRTYSGRLLAMSVSASAMPIGNYRLVVDPMRVNITIHGQGMQGYWALWVQWSDGQCRLIAASDSSEQGHWQVDKTLWMVAGDPTWIWVTCDDQLILYRALNRSYVTSETALMAWRQCDEDAEDAPEEQGAAQTGSAHESIPSAEAPASEPETVATPVETVPEEATCEPETVATPVETVPEEATCKPEMVETPVETAPEEATCELETVETPVETAPEEATCEPETVETPVETAPEEAVCEPETVETPMETVPEEVVCEQETVEKPLRTGIAARRRRSVRYQLGVLRRIPAPAATAVHPVTDLGAPQLERLLDEGESVQPFPGLFPGARFAKVHLTGIEEDCLVGEIPLGGGRGFFLLGVASRQGFQPPENLPEFAHYLPSMQGHGYWVRYIPWEDAAAFQLV